MEGGTIAPFGGALRGQSLVHNPGLPGGTHGLARPAPGPAAARGGGVAGAVRRRDPGRPGHGSRDRPRRDPGRGAARGPDRPHLLRAARGHAGAGRARPRGGSRVRGPPPAPPRRGDVPAQGARRRDHRARSRDRRAGRGALPGRAPGTLPPQPRDLGQPSRQARRGAGRAPARGSSRSPRGARHRRRRDRGSGGAPPRRVGRGARRGRPRDRNGPRLHAGGDARRGHRDVPPGRGAAGAGLHPRAQHGAQGAGLQHRVRLRGDRAPPP